jgi:hypothetical protein
MAPTPLPVLKVTVVPEFVLPLEPAVGVVLPPPPLAEEELLLEEEEPPPPELELLLELLPPLEPPLLLELELLEPPPPPELELLLEEEEEPPPPPEELELLEEPLLPPPDELELLLPPLPLPVSLLAAGRQPAPVASKPAKHRLAMPVPAFRRNRPKVTVFVMMPSLVPGGSRLNRTKRESDLLELTRWSGRNIDHFSRRMTSIHGLHVIETTREPMTQGAATICDGEGFPLEKPCV